MAELSRMAVLLVSILPFGDFEHSCDLDLVENLPHCEKHSHSGWVPLFYVASSTLLRALQIDVHGASCKEETWKLPKLALKHQCLPITALVPRCRKTGRAAAH